MAMSPPSMAQERVGATQAINPDALSRNAVQRGAEASVLTRAASATKYRAASHKATPVIRRARTRSRPLGERCLMSAEPP
jgi:hypothetical protein